MKRITIAAALAAALAGIPELARAQAVTWTYTFVAVDAVSTRGNELYVTGLLDGGAAPVERSLSFSSYAAPYDALAACQRIALLAMEKPGLYRLQLSPGSGTSACRLVRVTP